jgi:hypothetical protein
MFNWKKSIMLINNDRCMKCWRIEWRYIIE